MAALLAALDQDPAARRRTWATVLAVATVMGGLAFAANRLGSRGQAMCGGGAARFAGLWDAGGPSPRKEAVRAAFLKTGKSFAGQAYVATARLLDDYVSRWTSMYSDACEATHVRGDQSAEVLDLRMACLDGRLGNVRALSDVLARADEGVVLNGVSAAGALPSLDGCADVSALRAVVKPLDDPAIRKRVAELRQELARVTALRDAGPCGAAAARRVPLIAAAQATRYRPLEAETLNVIGYLGNFCGDPGVAIERLKQSYAAAVAGHHDLVAAEAAASIPVLAVNRLGQVAMARDWVRIAHASIDRLGGNDRIEGFLLSSEGVVAGAEHDLDGWVNGARRAQALTEKVLGPDHPLSITGLANIGDALAGVGRYEEALAADRVARTAGERVLGAEHPLVASTCNNECEVLNRLGRFEEARATCAHAIAIWRAAGTDLAIQSYGLTGLGLALLGEKRAEDAIAPLEQAVAAREAGHLAPELLGESRFALARALWARPRERERARALGRQARADSTSDAKIAATIDAWLADKR